MTFAYCTLITSDSYVQGALVLRQSALLTGSKIDFIAMATTDSISQSSLILLESHFTHVVLVPSLLSLNKQNLLLLGRPELDCTLTKIHLWNPDYVKYERIVFMDADTLILNNTDELFGYLNKSDFAAAPGTTHLESIHH